MAEDTAAGMAEGMAEGMEPRQIPDTARRGRRVTAPGTAVGTAPSPIPDTARRRRRVTVPGTAPSPIPATEQSRLPQATARRRLIRVTERNLPRAAATGTESRRSPPIQGGCGSRSASSRSLDGSPAVMLAGTVRNPTSQGSTGPLEIRRTAAALHPYAATATASFLKSDSANPADASLS